MVAAAEGAVVTTVTEPGADNNRKLHEVQEGFEAAGEEKDPAAKAAEAVGDSEEDGKECSRIETQPHKKDSILYKVRWKRYTSEDDTWEPKIRLEDCKEVLLEFRKKVAENKAKAVKKDIQDIK
ncbi:M-phase phosphoprotein 8 [Fukomys damarensis]|uniref:M-phase phosphoprotein 8 n=1 Tax=Fukomys damarensis TaxID=885580 RepID=A0A091D7A9_FUKDA|nr:M-phase phosphoprotein 8 [Fukomys damarensis]